MPKHAVLQGKDKLLATTHSTTIDGVRYQLRPAKRADLKAGAVLRYSDSRCTRRLIGFDGEDAIMRGLHGQPIEAVPADELLASGLFCFQADTAS